jgi:hypothetical protein
MKYVVHKNGKVYNFCKTVTYCTGKIVKSNKIYTEIIGTLCSGYRVTYYKSKQLRFHRLVAKGYIPNPDNKQQEVNHKDYDRLNNKVANLEWNTPHENRTHQSLRVQRTGCIYQYRTRTGKLSWCAEVVYKHKHITKKNVDKKVVENWLEQIKSRLI